MFGFFGGLVNAGYYTIGALIQGKTHNFDEMHTAQENRMHAFSNLISNLNYAPEQVTARKQYWHSQVMFLAHFLEKHAAAFPFDIAVRNRESLSTTLDLLLAQLDHDEFLPHFLKILEEDGQIEAVPSTSSGWSQLSIGHEDVVKEGDVIAQLKLLSNQGYFVIVNDAANSHRDGAAKYSRGSLEELLSRFSDQAIKLVLDFDNVHERNSRSDLSQFSGHTPEIDVSDYQKRYLKMLLTIMSKLVKNDNYLETPEFFADLLQSFPSKPRALPIYFDMQNNAYEIPVDGGFYSRRVFKDTSEVANVDQLLDQLDAPSFCMGVTSFAAPDLRTIETTPLDIRSTSNKILANPAGEGTLGYMFDHGISFQCERAIEQSKLPNTPSVHVLFILPGCGAFKNPEKIAAAHFVSTIKSYQEQFNEHNITFNIVEYNPKLANLLKETWQNVGSELSELNKAIHQTKHELIRNRAIAVRERILDLYNSGNTMEELNPLIKATTDLLQFDTQNKEAQIAAYKLQAAHFHQQPEGISHAIAAAMMKLISAITKLFGIKHFDKDVAFKESANELLINLENTEYDDFETGINFSQSVTIPT